MTGIDGNLKQNTFVGGRQESYGRLLGKAETNVGRVEGVDVQGT
ncbi:MAG: hypothetical protein R3D03_04560 [Geminicoccaceae bacterium]